LDIVTKKGTKWKLLGLHIVLIPSLFMAYCQKTLGLVAGGRKKLLLEGMGGRSRTPREGDLTGIFAFIHSIVRLTEEWQKETLLEVES